MGRTKEVPWKDERYVVAFWFALLKWDYFFPYLQLCELKNLQLIHAEIIKNKEQNSMRCN